jgi:hypothetical protein
MRDDKMPMQRPGHSENVQVIWRGREIGDGRREGARSRLLFLARCVHAPFDGWSDAGMFDAPRGARPGADQPVPCVGAPAALAEISLGRKRSCMRGG